MTTGRINQVARPLATPAREAPREDSGPHGGGRPNGAPAGRGRGYPVPPAARAYLRPGAPEAPAPDRFHRIRRARDASRGPSDARGARRGRTHGGSRPAASRPPPVGRGEPAPSRRVSQGCRVPARRHRPRGGGEPSGIRGTNETRAASAVGCTGAGAAADATRRRLLTRRHVPGATRPSRPRASVRRWPGRARRRRTGGQRTARVAAGRRARSHVHRYHVAHPTYHTSHACQSRTGLSGGGTQASSARTGLGRAPVSRHGASEGTRPGRRRRGLGTCRTCGAGRHVPHVRSRAGRGGP